MTSTFDLEFADDTVLVARTAEVMNRLLECVERIAGRYGLVFNKDKTHRLSINSEEAVMFANGTPVPRKTHVKYLGCVLEQTGGANSEISSRIASATAASRSMRPVWGANGLNQKLRIRILNA